MSHWTEPNNIAEWSKRLISPISLSLIIIVTGIFISEFRFDFMEKMLGSYLVKTNEYRPKTGAIWEKGKKTSEAYQTLDEMVSGRLNSHNIAIEASDLKKIASSLNPGQWIMISPDQFRKIIMKIPEKTVSEVMPMIELVKFFSDESWERTYIDKTESGLRVYLLDGKNLVLKRLDIPETLLLKSTRLQQKYTGNFNSIKEFENRIYTADVFFKVLDSLSSEIQDDIIIEPEKLLEYPGKIKRVGISDEAEAGFIKLGFEIEYEGKSRIILLSGKEMPVWSLRQILEGGEIDTVTIPGEALEELK